MDCIYTLFELEPIGVNGALESVMSFGFCSENCADTYAEVHTGQVFSKALEPSDFENGHVCDHCGGQLP